MNKNINELMEEIKPFLRPKSYRIYHTTKEWELTSSNNFDYSLDRRD